MWKNRRRIVALLGGAATLLLPFLEIRGRSVVRFDLPTLSLHLFGAVVPIDEFYLVLLGALFLVALTLWVTVVFGRLWCGWLCPQTVIGEIGEWIASALPPGCRSAGKTAVLLPFTAVVSISLLWYFVPPAEATRDLVRSPILLGFFLAQWGVIFFMVAVVGTRFCKTVCPYAMLQNVLADRETLAVAYDPARAECLGCERCARVCPVGIDIRAGGQRECIACASCIDACREVTSRRNPVVAPFIAYRGTVLRGKAYLFAGGCLAAALVLLAAIWSRPDVRFAVQWEGTAGTPRGNVYRYSVRNDSDRPIVLALSVEGPARLLDDPEVAVPSRGRVTGKVTVQRGDGTPGEILITASGRGFRIVRKAAFP
jgi:polyferredoxin